MSQYFQNHGSKGDLDRTDYEIMALLRKNARRSNREIARHLGIADSTCSARIRRLEEVGALVGYRAIVNPAAIGIGLEAIVAVQLVRHTSGAIDAFWHHTSELSEATRVFHLTGNDDFLVHLLLASADALRQITAEVLTTWEEVARIQTSVVFEHRDNLSMPDLR